MIPKKAWSKRQLWIDTLLICIIFSSSLLITISTYWQFLKLYTITGDDSAFIFDSANFFNVSPASWFTNGFRFYFKNYPEAFRDFTFFIRPVQNIVVYLTSYIAQTPNSGIFLIPNHIVHAASCALVYIFCRISFISFNKKESLVCAVLFMGSVSAISGMSSPAFGGDMLAAFFSMSALIGSNLYVKLNQKYSYRKILLFFIFAALILAVYTKETCIISPVLVAANLVVERIKKNKLKSGSATSLLTVKSAIIDSWLAITLIILPTIIYSVYIYLIHTISEAGIGAYTTNSISVLRIAKAVIYTIIGYFAPPVNTPGDLVRYFSGACSHYQSLSELSRDILSIIFNVIIWTVLTVIILRKIRISISMLILIALSVIAMAIPFTLAPTARFMYFGQMFTIPFAVYITLSLIRHPFVVNRFIAIGLISMFFLINPIFFLYNTSIQQKILIETSQLSGKFQETLISQLKDSRIKRVYLVNDFVYRYGAKEQLQLISTLANRSDVEVRVINSIEEKRCGWNLLPQKDGNLFIEYNSIDDEVLITTQLNNGWCFSFDGADSFKNLGINNLIEYKLDNQFSDGTLSSIRKMTVAIHNVSNILLIGFNLNGESKIHTWTLDHPVW